MLTKVSGSQPQLPAARRKEVPHMPRSLARDSTPFPSSFLQKTKKEEGKKKKNHFLIN
jgi:hypothetical protein